MTPLFQPEIARWLSLFLARETSHFIVPKLLRAGAVNIFHPSISKPNKVHRRSRQRRSVLRGASSYRYGQGRLNGIVKSEGKKELYIRYVCLFYAS